MYRHIKTIYFLLCVCLAPGAMAESIFSNTTYLQTLEVIKQGDYKRAHRMLKTLDESYPDHPVILNNLGVVSVELGDIETAEKLFERVIAIYQNANTAYHNLQKIYNYRAAANYRDALDIETPLPALTLEMIKKMPTPSTPPATASTQLADIQQKILADKEVNRPLVEEQGQAQAAQEGDDDKALASFIESWADAWSNKDAEGYFSHYIADYRPRSGRLDHSAWKKQRAARLRAPKTIKVRVSKIQITPKDDYYSVRFYQDYRSNLLRSRVVKQMNIRKQASGSSGWKIFSEKVLKRYR